MTPALVMLLFFETSRQFNKFSCGQLDCYLRLISNDLAVINCTFPFVACNFYTRVLLFVMVFQLPLPFYKCGNCTCHIDPLHLVTGTPRDLDPESGQWAFKF